MSWNDLTSWQSLAITALVIISLKFLSMFIKWKKTNRLQLPSMSGINFSWLNKEWVQVLGFILLLFTIVIVVLTQLDIQILNDGVSRLWSGKKILFVTSLVGLVLAILFSAVKIKPIEGSKGLKKLMTFWLGAVSIGGLLIGSGILGQSTETVTAWIAKPTAPAVAYVQPVEETSLTIHTKAGEWTKPWRNPWNKIGWGADTNTPFYKVRINESNKLIFIFTPQEGGTIPPTVSIHSVEFLTPVDSTVILERGK